jgi:hypothetical protein
MSKELKSQPLVGGDGAVLESSYLKRLAVGRAMKVCEYLLTRVLLILGLLILGIEYPELSILETGASRGGLMGSAAQAAGEAPKDTIAAQIRLQGFACDKPQSAVRDAKRSKPDEAVWVLKCSNATYRIRLIPDMAAKVERLQ